MFVDWLGKSNLIRHDMLLFAKLTHRTLRGFCARRGADNQWSLSPGQGVDSLNNILINMQQIEIFPHRILRTP